MKLASGKFLIWLIWLGITTITAINRVASADLPLDQIQLPTGFSIEIFAEEVPGARSMTASPDGVLFVGTRGDRIYAIQDMDQDMVAGPGPSPLAGPKYAQWGCFSRRFALRGRNQSNSTF